MKLKVIVTHADYEPWRSISTKGQIPTWISASSENVIFAQGKKLPTWIRNIDSKLWGLRWKKKTGLIVLLIEIAVLRLLNRFVAKPRIVRVSSKITIWDIWMPDSDFLMSKKIEAVFKRAELEDFDFLVMTTSSSYLNMRVLKSELNTMPRTGFAGGKKVSQSRNTFLSGSFRVFSKDVATRVSENYKKRNLKMVEDMALGDLLRQLKIPLVDIPSLNIESEIELSRMENRQIKSQSHFRLKSGTLNKRNDVSLMLELHKIIEGTK